MEVNFKKLADDMMTAARLTGFKVSTSRSRYDASLVFPNDDGSILYGASEPIFRREDTFRCLNKEDEYIYFNDEEEFVNELTKQFRNYDVDFTAVRRASE